MSADGQIRAFWREEFSLIALLFLIFVGIVVFAFRLPFDARLFPMVIGTTGLFLCAIIIIDEIRRWQSRDSANAVPKEEPSAGADRPRQALALLSAPVFGLLLWLFGFFMASLVALLAMPRMMGMRNWRLILVVAFATIVALALIFPLLLGVNLPHGVVGDWLLDRLRVH